MSNETALDLDVIECSGNQHLIVGQGQCESATGTMRIQCIALRVELWRGQANAVKRGTRLSTQKGLSRKCSTSCWLPAMPAAVCHLAHQIPAVLSAVHQPNTRTDWPKSLSALAAGSPMSHPRFHITLNGPPKQRLLQFFLPPLFFLSTSSAARPLLRLNCLLLPSKPIATTPLSAARSSTLAF